MSLRPTEDGAPPALAQEEAVPFRPARLEGQFLEGSFRVREWEPGRRIRLRKGLGLGVAVSIPALALGCAALAVVANAVANSDDIVETVLVTLLFGAFGAAGLGPGLWLVHSALPRETIVDWEAGVVTVRDRLRRVVIPFPTIVDLQMRSETEVRSGNRRSTRYWRSVLSLRHRPPDSGETCRTELAATRQYENPDDPHQQMLPLVSALAAAMHVEERVE